MSDFETAVKLLESFGRGEFVTDVYSVRNAQIIVTGGL